MHARSAVTSTEPRKIALVIGNNKYPKNPLFNCVNDANALSKKLEEIEFNVTKKLDLNYEDMDRGIRSFTESIKPGDFVLVFFAGHGVQWEDQNYLIPCDEDRIQDPIDLKYRATNAQRVLELMSNKDPFVVVYLLDCCRDYWLPSQARGRSRGGSSRGMAVMSDVAGSVIVFACAPGKTAEDGSSTGSNGVFTRHLLEHITKPGEHILMLMLDVSNGVVRGNKRGTKTLCSKLIIEARCIIGIA